VSNIKKQEEHFVVQWRMRGAQFKHKNNFFKINNWFWRNTELVSWNLFVFTHFGYNETNFVKRKLKQIYFIEDLTILKLTYYVEAKINPITNKPVLTLSLKFCLNPYAAGRIFERFEDLLFDEWDQQTNFFFIDIYTLFQNDYNILYQARRIVIQRLCQLGEAHPDLRSGPAFFVFNCYWCDVFEQVLEDFANERRRQFAREMLEADIFWPLTKKEFDHRQKTKRVPQPTILMHLIYQFCSAKTMFQFGRFVVHIRKGCFTTVQFLPFAQAQVWNLLSFFSNWLLKKKAYNFFVVNFAEFLAEIYYFPNFFIKAMPEINIDYNILEFTDGIYLLQNDRFIPRPKSFEICSFHQFYSLLWEQSNFTFLYYPRTFHNLLFPKYWFTMYKPLLDVSQKRMHLNMWLDSFYDPYEYVQEARNVWDIFESFLWYHTNRRDVCWRVFRMRAPLMHLNRSWNERPWKFNRKTLLLKRTLEFELPRVLVYFNKSLDYKRSPARKSQFQKIFKTYTCKAIVFPKGLYFTSSPMDFKR
jgi:hypothetical protein